MVNKLWRYGSHSRDEIDWTNGVIPLISFPNGTAWKKSTLYIHWAQASSSSSHPRFCTCSPTWDWHWLPWRASAVLHPFGLAAQRHPPAKTTCLWAPHCARLQNTQEEYQRGILTCDLGKFSGVKMLKLQALLIQIHSVSLDLYGAGKRKDQDGNEG